MKEVSIRALEAVLDRVRRSGLEPQTLLEGTDLSIRELEDSSTWISWDQFATIMDNVGRLFSDDALREIGASFLEAKATRPLRSIARLLFDTRSLYHWTGSSGTGVGDSFFPLVRARTRDTGPERLEIELELPEAYRMSREFFIVSHGAFQGLATLLGAPRAQVELTVRGRSGIYDIQLPQQNAQPSMLRRVLGWPIDARVTANSLREVLHQSQHRLRALTEAQRALERQADQLETVHRITSVVHRDLDLDLTIEAVCAALTTVSSVSRVELHLHLRSRPTETSPVGSDSVVPLRRPIVARATELGELLVWPSASAVQSELEELLDLIAPTVATAIRAALEHAEVHEHRRSLEKGIEERTNELQRTRRDLERTVRALAEAPEDPTAIAAPAASAGVPTILIAEDDESVRRSLIRLLARHYRIVEAKDGVEALRLAEIHHPDLLLTDLNMPGLDGFELIRAFRQLPGNRLAPALVLTGEDDHRIASFEAGAIDYIQKPFDGRELSARLRSQLAQRDIALKLHESAKLSALGGLVAALAHEIRNPANALLNAVQPLKELLPAELVEEETPTGQLISIIERCSEQVASLSRNLLELDGRGVMMFAEHSLPGMIHRARALAQASLRGVEFRQSLDYDGPIDCAGALMTQALVRLLENAGEAAGPGGWVEVRSDRSDGEVSIEVMDSGRGVPAELRERIFEPFFSTKPVGEGTGLGLTTAHRIVERHGGRLELRGRGDESVFRVTIPVRSTRLASEERSRAT